MRIFQPLSGYPAELWIRFPQFLQLLAPSWNEAHSVDAQDLALLSQQPTRISFRVQ